MQSFCPFSIDNFLSSSSVTTLFLPLRVRPYTDGYSWARREGYDKHAGLLQGEELTDDDDDNP